MPENKTIVFVAVAIFFIFIGFNIFIKTQETHSLSEQGNEKLPSHKSESLKTAETKTFSSASNKIQKFNDISSSKESYFTHEIPFGAILPAALMDHGSEDDSPQISEMLISLEQEFFSELRSMKDSKIPSDKLWEQLRAKYDERYIALFGQDAYLEATSLAAEEAREDYKTAP